MIREKLVWAWKVLWGMPLTGCDRQGHDLKTLYFNHVHFRKGVREIYCFNGPVEYCARKYCPYQKFLGDPSLCLEGCDYDAAPLKK